MNENEHPEQAEQAQKALPIRANDPPLLVAAATVWNRMVENHSLDVKRACEETGVPRWHFYNALKSEVVQAEVGRWMEVMRAVEAKLLRDNWYEVISYQIDIATGRKGDPREAVSAARFLDGVRDKIAPAKHEEDKLSRQAKDLLESFLGQGKITLRREIQEILVESPETPEPVLDAIDG